MRKVLFFFGQLGDEDVEWLTKVGRKQVVRAGQNLIREGEHADAVYIVLSGQLSVLPAVLRGRELARLASGEIVGEMSFVDSRPPSATVRALEDTVVLAIGKLDLEGKFERDAHFAWRFYKALAVYLSQDVRRHHRLLALSTGTGAGTGNTRLDPRLEDEVDELDATILDHVQVAGERFDRMLKYVLNP